MPVSKVQTPDGRTMTIEHPEGATSDQIIAFAAQSYTPEESETTLLGSTGEFFKGIPRGFASSFATAGQGLTELTDAGLNYIGLDDVITDEDTEAVAGYVDSFQKSLQEGALGADPAYSDAFATKFGEGLGSFASFLVPGGALKVAGKLGKMSKLEQAATSSLAASPLAVGGGAGQQAQRVQAARERGIDISEDVEDKSIGLGGLIGLSELAPLARVLKAIPKSQLSGIFPRIESAVKTGLLEGGQELAAGLMQDATEKGLYNPDLEIGESAWDDLTVGGAVGATADLLVNYAAGRKAKTAEEVRQEQLLEEEKDIRTAVFEQRERNKEAASAEREARGEIPADNKVPLRQYDPKAEPVQVSPLQEAKDYRLKNDEDISRMELEATFGPIEEAQYESIIAEAQQAQPEATILALPSPDERKTAAENALRERMKQVKVDKDFDLKVVDLIRDVQVDTEGNLTFIGDGELDYGNYAPAAKVIQLSLDSVFADAKGQPVTEQQIISSLTRTFNHELVHGLRAIDLIDQKELDLLTKITKKYKKKEGDQELTYLDWAVKNYGKPKEGQRSLTESQIQEEAIAEMVADALSGEIISGDQQITIGGKPRNIIQRIISFFKQMTGFTEGANARDFSDFLGKLESGEIGSRERFDITREVTPDGVLTTPTGPVRTTKYLDVFRETTQPIGKQSLADQPIVQLEEETELEEDTLASRRVGRPDTGVRPEVERAYSEFKEGRIDRNKYDSVVRGTINEYDFVPQPATTQEMFNALDKNKKEKINLPIEEATEVGLRLDIPAYTNHGVWVPTIHAKGKASHRATAAINNADFTRTPQGKAQKVMEGGAKSPFAQIKGGFINRTDAENEAIAQQALGNSSWTQVGFDPRRHSFFYDRKTGEAVTTADEVVQVGPLVLAKNAVKDPRFQEETLYSRRTPYTAINLEVAPDPNNEELSNRWNSISVAEQLMLSNEVGPDVARMVIEDTGAIAKVLPQIGSYKDKTNPSFTVRMDAGNPLDLAKNLGFVLDQESMMIISSEDFDSAYKSSLVDIDVGRMGQNQIDEIFQTLRGIEGIPQVSGQSTVDGKMLILLDENVDADMMASAFDRALNGKYDISTSEVFASFPEKAEYDYASPQVIPRENTADFRERYLAFRSQTQRRIADAVSRSLSDPRAGRATARNYDRTIEGALLPDGKLELTHYSPEKLTVTDPSRAGTGADRFKKNRPTSGTFFGVTKARENPYDRNRDPALRGVGRVENRFAIDAGDLYVVSDYLNPDALKDPRGVFTKFPNNDVDYDSMLRKTKELGYKGFLISTPNLGKVAVLNEPLAVIDESMYSRRTPDNIQLTTRKHPPQKVESAVLKDEALAVEEQGFPRVSFRADPDAQYVAQDPDAGFEPRFDEQSLSSRRQPERSASFQNTLDQVIGDRPTGPSQYNTYLEATGEGKLNYWLTKFKQDAINRYARLEHLNKDPALRDNLADSSSIAATLFADRSRGVVASAIKYGVPVYRNGITKVEDFRHNGKDYRGLVDLMSMLYSKEHGDLTKDAQAYAIAMRGRRLSGEIGDGKPLQVPVTKKQRDEIILNAKRYKDAEGNSIIEEWYDAWQAYNSYTIKFLQDTGVLNERTSKLWQESSDYIPFYRAAAGEKGAPAIAQRVFGNDLTSKVHIKEYKGSTEAIDVPLMEAIGLNLTAAIEMGMRNVAQQRITRDMQTLGLAEQLGKGEADTAATVKFKVKGQEVRFNIYDPLVYESMQSVPELPSFITSIAAKPATFLREMVTRDPGFMAVNMLRDTLSTFTTSGSNFIPVVDTLRGLGDGIENLERTGVVGGYDYSNDPDDVVKFYQGEMKRRGVDVDGERGGALGMFKRIWDWAGDATTASDAATRNAVYKDVLARTGNEAEAHFQALEVINFSRRGANALARGLTATIPFLNARFQGLDVFWRAGLGKYSANSELNRRRAMQSFYTRALMLSSLTGLYYLMVSDDDQYKEQSEVVRDNNWVLPTSSGVPVLLSIPFEVGLFFKTIPETLLAATIGEKSSKETRETIQRGIVSTLEINPLGVQIISPLVEASMNKSFYTQRQIVPYYMESNVATGLQDRVSTSEIAKFIGSELGISPIKIDHVLTGYGGTIGGYALSAIDTLLRSEMVTGDEASKMPTLRPYEYPMIKRFFGSKEGAGLREDAYDLYREINKIVTTTNKLMKEGRQEELEAYMSSKGHLLDLKSDVYAIKKALDQTRKYREEILRSDIDPDKKKEMIDDLDARLNEYLKVVPSLKKAADLPAFESRFMQRVIGE